MSEHAEQSAFFQWVAAAAGRIPELRLFYAIPNGGWRALTTARRLSAEGLRAGVPDTHLPVPRGGYAGLWIEFKHGRNTLSPEQREWVAALEGLGHCVRVCRDSRQAIAATEDFLGLPDELRTVLYD
ncbi:MAG: VRR-NUC domain-containing protein [Anaerolineales bacterium]|nr:VRR-NUC domain-containing protein [Anaerolineales bacterium]